MVSIFLSDGTKLYQWDSNRQIQIIGSNNIEEVHFCHRNDKTALVVKPVIQNNFIVADIPNVLLQSSEDIMVYLYAEERTIKEQVLRVQSKNRPDDYVYEQTEILRYETLDKRLTGLEETLKNVALKENDPTVPEWAKQPNKPAYTANEVGAMSIETAEEKLLLKQDKSNLVTDINLYNLDDSTYPSTLAVFKYVEGKIYQSDWNQSDSKKLDYIKNRPFYEEIKPSTLVVSGYGNGSPAATLVGGKIDTDKEYLVNVDGKGFFLLKPNQEVSLEKKFHNSIGTEMILVAYSDGSGAFQIVNAVNQFFQVNVYEPEKIIVQIDEKFIPDTIARKEDVANLAFADDLEVIEILTKTGIIEPVLSNENKIFTDNQNKIYLI